METKEKVKSIKDKTNEGSLNKSRDLEKRTFSFAVRVIKLLGGFKSTIEANTIRYQLSKAATAIGANYEEAQGAYSKDDFSYKISICFREAKESNYWLRIIKATNILDNSELDCLIQESTEIKNIFGTIVKKVSVRKDV